MSDIRMLDDTLRHFGYDPEKYCDDEVYTGRRKAPLNKILEKISKIEFEKKGKVRVAIDYDPDYERFLIVVTNT